MRYHFHELQRQKAIVKKLQKHKKIIVTCAAACAAVAVPFVANAAAAAISRRKNPPCGSFVELSGKKMHIFSEGSGTKTLVFLGGTSISAPAIDFMPLSARLRSDFRCVTPEPFGYGYSDCTHLPRTLQNITNELRYGLLLAGFKPPYTLFAEGDGGLSAIYWAARFPKEIECVIGEDTWVGALIPSSLKRSKLLSLLNKSGAVRMCIALGAGKQCLVNSTAFDQTRLPAAKSIAANTALNAAHIDGGNRMGDNFSAASKLRYPQKCKLLMFLSDNRADEVAIRNIDWVSEHEKQTVQSVQGQCHVLRGSAPLHRTQADFIAAQIRDFFTVI